MRVVASPDRELVTLLTASRAHNAQAGITGLLLFAHESFLQVLEGPEEAVMPLFDRIGKDGRHRSVRRLALEPISERRFAEWTMGFAHPADLTLSEILPGYTASGGYPLVDSDLVLDGTVADRLLALYSRTSA